MTLRSGCLNQRESSRADLGQSIPRSPQSPAVLDRPDTPLCASVCVCVCEREREREGEKERVYVSANCVGIPIEVKLATPKAHCRT